ncbi:cytochrome c-type biogenesis protein CcmH [Bartonella sp. DGB2]|uniref:cytochrome c-type biogenesis protein n=1 Tax=Bartonella sp. DGB2 TaxID=3388426 RepID=UPI0039903318
MLLMLHSALAVQPDEMLENSVLEARARAISSQLRCLVCQNESIDDSNASLAHDLRLLVRDRLKHGDSDQEVINFLVARYGEFILLRPRFEPKTWVLWLSPLALVLGAGGAIIWRGRRYNRQHYPPLDEDEQRQLATLLEKAE